MMPGVEALLAFLRGLDEIGTHYTLGHHSSTGITVYVAALPRERWEVEFMDDGTIEIERFQGTEEGVSLVSPR
jgi:hypothetical protein